MSCSRKNAVKYLIDKKLVKPNMDIYTALPSERLVDTIDRLTQRAKSVYGVDMGPLFQIKFRDVTIGNYTILGSNSVVTKVRVEPNDAAFEAIDRSKAQEEIGNQRRLDEYRKDQEGKVVVEYDTIQREGNYIINDDGDIMVPTSLPQINVRC